jgi:2-C-methyl-D-erythritol 2,4-cyclodiphosphate synthase
MDMVIEAEKPKLKPYFLPRRQNIAEVLDIRVDQVGLKGKTSEGARYRGGSEAIAVHAVVLVEIQSP